MPWEKLGLIHAPSGEHAWARSYAHLPTAFNMSDDVIRVYFSSLDEHNFGRIGFAELSAENPARVLRVASEPVLDLGPLGSFEDSGVTPSCLIAAGSEQYLYYIGWQRTERVPYMLFTGLAISEDGGLTFRKASRTPVLDRTDQEPYSRSAPCVLVEEGVFKCWYWSCTGWSDEGGWVHYNNVICTLESADGIHWDGTPHVCITTAGDDYSAGRPWVIHEEGRYRMWYSVRSRAAENPYRIAYAESRDGRAWDVKPDAAVIDRSAEGWDSEMVCYPCVIDAAGKRYMFYNGNRHGKTGFGCAVFRP